MNKKVVLTTSKGVKIGCWFGLGALGKTTKLLNIPADELLLEFKNNMFEVIPALFLESARYYALRNDKEFEMTLFSATDILDDEGMGGEFFNSFIDAFTKSMVEDVPTETPEQSINKKKSPRKK
jgi:hypothetical protein